MQLTRAVCFSALTLSFGAGCDAPLTPTTAAQPLAITEPAHGRHHGHDLDVRHVLLLSIDGMHEVDLARFIASQSALDAGRARAATACSTPTPGSIASTAAPPTRATRSPACSR